MYDEDISSDEQFVPDRRRNRRYDRRLEQAYHEGDEGSLSEGDLEDELSHADSYRNKLSWATWVRKGEPKERTESHFDDYVERFQDCWQRGTPESILIEEFPKHMTDMSLKNAWKVAKFSAKTFQEVVFNWKRLLLECVKPDSLEACQQGPNESGADYFLRLHAKRVE